MNIDEQVRYALCGEVLNHVWGKIQKKVTNTTTHAKIMQIELKVANQIRLQTSTQIWCKLLEDIC
jgi:hypothetical protein